MGFFDTLGDIASSVFDFATDKDNIRNILRVGAGAYDIYDKNKRRRDLLNAMKEAEAEGEAEAGGEAAGGGPMYDAGMMREAVKMQEAYLKKILAMYQPYIDVRNRLLPQQEKLYGTGLQGLQSLYGKMLTPEYLQTTNQTTPAWQVGIPLPEYLRNGR